MKHFTNTCTHNLLQWLKHDFLNYLQSWEMQALSNKHLNKSAINKMLLPKETRDGLMITGI